MALRIELLGPPQVFDGSQPLKIVNRQYSLPLLGYLLAHRGQPISRTHLAFTLWPDVDEERSRTELRRYLYRLRRALPQTSDREYIVADEETVMWNVDSDFTFDVAEFEHACNQPERLRDAVALYRGDLLEEVYDDWAVAERERLRERYTGALWSLIVAARSRRAFGEAADAALRLLTADPWREDAVRQLMAVRYQSGDAAGALAAFERFARALRKEMNVEPMAETAALRETIVHGAPLGDATPEAASPSGARSRTTAAGPFVGRSGELELLDGLWQRAARGEASFVVIEGEPGIGKSRLAAEFALKVEAGGGRVLIGSTSSPEHRPYQAIVDALRSSLPLVTALRLAPQALAAVAELVPELRTRRPDLPSLEPLEEGAERTRLFDALAQIFAALARPRPILVILEDLHWAGSVTIEALRFLTHRVHGCTMLLVATARADETGRNHPLRRLERSLRGTPLATRLALGALAPSVAAELARAFDASASTQTLADACERSEGNPLFLIEMLHEAATGGSLAAPSGIRSMIEERAARLDPATRAVAEIAAVAGAAFDVELLGDASGLSRAELTTALDELLDRRLIRDTMSRSRYDYAFTHQLVHAALYASIDPALRAQRHHRIAVSLEEAPHVAEESAGEIAFHHERAGDRLAAARWYARAALRARAIFANEEACEFADRALDLLEHDDAAQAFDLLMIGVDCAERSGDGARADRDLERARAIAPAAGGEAENLVIERSIERARHRGDDAAELAAIAALADSAERSGDRRRIALAQKARAQRALHAFEPEAAVAEARQADALFAQTGDDAGRVAALEVLAAALAELGRSGEAAETIERARAIAEGSGDALLRMRVLRVAGRVAQARQDNRRFAEIARSTLDLCRATGDRQAEAHAHYQLGTASWSLWRVREGLEHLRRSIEIFEQLQSPRVSPSLNNLGGFLLDLGDFAGAREAFERALELAVIAERHDVVAHVTANTIEAAWLNGDRAAMPELAERARAASACLSNAPRLEAVAIFARARALRCAGEGLAALALLDDVRERFLALGRHAEMIDVLDDLALLHLANGATTPAYDCVERSAALAGAKAELHPLAYPSRHHWIAACVMKNAGHALAAAASLDLALNHYRDRLRAIDDPLLQQSYALVAFHRAIVAAAAEDRWPEPGDPCSPLAFAR